MIEIAEFLAPTPSPLWKLAKQAGVGWAVGGLPCEFQWIERIENGYNGMTRRSVLSVPDPLNPLK